jgi:ketosteroid isomerase-like protein
MESRDDITRRAQEATTLDRAQFRGPIGDLDVSLADVEAVRRLASTYALGIDRRDEALVRSLFTDDALVAGSLGGAPASEYIPQLIAGASRFASTQHNITNQYVARAGDDLVVHSYAVALHFGHDGTDQSDLAMGVEYRDRATRVDGGWLMSHRHTVVVWTRRRPRPDSSLE